MKVLDCAKLPYQICKGSVKDRTKLAENMLQNFVESVEKDFKNSDSINFYDIFDKIDETEAGVGGEIQPTDALQKLDSIYGVAFEGRTYDIGNRLEWLKTSIEFALDDDEFRDDLVKYMKNYI